MYKSVTLSSIALSLVACVSASSWDVSRQLSPNSLFAYSESQVAASGLMLGDSTEQYPAYRVATALTPNDWQVAFSTDRAALSKIEWSAGALWTDVLHEWGQENRLNIMLDGGNRIAIISNEQARRMPGVQWVNSQNPLHQEMYAPQYRFDEYKKYQQSRVSRYLNMPESELGDLNETQARIYMLLSIEQQAAPKPIEMGPLVSTMPEEEKSLPKDVDIADAVRSESAQPLAKLQAKDSSLAESTKQAEQKVVELQEEIDTLEATLRELLDELEGHREHNDTDIEQRRLRHAQAAREIESTLLASRRAQEAQLRDIHDAEEARLLIAREEAQAARQQRISAERNATDAEDALRRERHAKANEEYRTERARIANEIRQEAEERRLAREAEIVAKREARERYMAMQNEYTENGVLREYAVGDLGTSLTSGSLKQQVNNILLDSGLVDEEAHIFWEFGRNYRWPRDIELRRSDIDELLTTIMTPFGLRVTFTMNGMAIISQH